MESKVLANIRMLILIFVLRTSRRLNIQIIDLPGLFFPGSVPFMNPWALHEV